MIVKKYLKLKLFDQRLRKFLFSEASSFNLAVCRILFYSYLLTWAGGVAGYANYSRHPEVAYKPTGLFLLFGESHFAHGFYTLWGNLYWISIIFSIVGFMGRISFVLCFLSYFFLTGMAQAHMAAISLTNPTLFMLLVFAASKAHYSISVDSFLFKKIKSFPSLSAEFNWPVKSFQIIFVSFFFIAALEKLKASGLAWIFSENLTNQYVCSNIRRWDKVSAGISQLGLNYWAADFPLFNRFSSALVLFAEFFAPAALIWRNGRRYILGILFSMQILTTFLVFINPWASIGLYIFWIDWEKWLKPLPFKKR